MKQLSDLAVITDCEHKTAPATEEAPYGYSVGTRAIRNGCIDYANVRPVSEETYRLWAARRTPLPGDLILAREAPVGDVVMVPEDRKVCLGQRTVLISPDPDQLDFRYLHAWLHTPLVQEWMRLHSEGSTVKHLNVRDIYKIPLGLLPALDEQKRIAGVLGAFDDLIETNRQLLGAIEELLRSLFVLAGFDREPKGDAVRLGDLVELNPRMPKPQGIAPYVDMASVPTDSALIGPPLERQATGGAKFKNGDTIMARITPCLENGKSALVKNLPEGVTGVGSTEFIVLRGTPSTGEFWPYALVRSPRFHTFAVQQMGDGTSGRQRVSAQTIADYRLPVPNLEELRSYRDKADALLPTMLALQEELYELTRQRDELLPLLMSGKVRVSEVSDDILDRGV